MRTIDNRNYNSYSGSDIQELSMTTLTRLRQVRPKQPEPTANFWLGLNLHAFRKKRGLTQESLAAAAGITARCLRDIENAVPESNPELKTISALARVLGLEVSVLFKKRPESELPEV